MTTKEMLLNWVNELDERGAKCILSHIVYDNYEDLNELQTALGNSIAVWTNHLREHNPEAADLFGVK